MIRVDEDAFARSPGQFDRLCGDGALRPRLGRAGFDGLVGRRQLEGSVRRFGQGRGGNVVVGDVLVIDSHANLIRSDGPRIAAIGVDDLVIIATGDAVLVTKLSHAQRVREAAEWFEKERGDGNAPDRE